MICLLVHYSLFCLVQSFVEAPCLILWLIVFFSFKICLVLFNVFYFFVELLFFLYYFPDLFDYLYPLVSLQASL